VTTNANPICTGSTLILNGSAANGVASWSWSGPNSFNSITQVASLNISQLSEGGTYTISASNICGTSTAAVLVVVQEIPEHPAASVVNADLCEGETILLSGNADGNISNWVWSGPNGFTSFDQNPVIIQATLAATGNYDMTASNNCGQVMASVNVTVNANPVQPGLTQSGNYLIVSSLIAGDHVQWYYDGNAIVGNDDDSLLCMGVGAYLCTVTNSFGCSTSSGMLSVTCIISDINYISDESFTLYPNPTNEKVTLSFDGYSGKFAIKIIDVLGKEIYRTDFSSTSIHSTKEISLGHFADGIYFLSVESTNSRRVVKIIKE
jgi:hypothetical protein